MRSTSCQSSGGVCRARPSSRDVRRRNSADPALLTSTSKSPRRAPVEHRRGAARVPRRGDAITLPVSDRAAAVSRSGASRRPFRDHVKRRLANRSAVARPIPEPAPVTTTMRASVSQIRSMIVPCHAAARTHRDQRGGLAAALELVERVPTSMLPSPDRMPSAIAPPFTLRFSGPTFMSFMNFEHDRRERFVHFPEVDVARRHSRFFSAALRRRTRCGQHDDGSVPAVAVITTRARGLSPCAFA